MSINLNFSWFSYLGGLWCSRLWFFVRNSFIKIIALLGTVIVDRHHWLLFNLIFGLKSLGQTSKRSHVIFFLKIVLDFLGKIFWFNNRRFCFWELRFIKFAVFFGVLERNVLAWRHRNRIELLNRLLSSINIVFRSFLHYWFNCLSFRMLFSVDNFFGVSKS